MTFSLKGLKTITNYQYEPACGILSLFDIFYVFGMMDLDLAIENERTLGICQK